MVKQIIFLLILFISFNAFAGDLQGIGYGDTKERAKEEALTDLSHNIEVQVFSKHEQTTYKSNNKITSDYLRFTKLSSNLPLINPSIFYTWEKNKYKAIALLDKPYLYGEKLNDIANKINDITKDVKTSNDKALNYKILTSVEDLYNEYETYKVVADVIGVVNYNEPKIASSEARKIILEIEEAPPTLDIVADVLTKDMDEKDIYVYPLTYVGKDNITEFGRFFKDVLSAKINSVEVAEDGRNKLRCSYALNSGYYLITCSLTTGVSKVLKSSIVKIPKELVDIQAVPKPDTASILNANTLPKTDYKIWLKLSTTGDNTFLRENEPFSLLVKANKAGYIYFLSTNNAPDGEGNIVPLGWNNEFIKYIDESQVNKWVSLGQFRVKAPFGSESLYAFGLEEKPNPEYILPEYATNNIGYLRNIRGEILLQDILYLFKKQTGDKTMSHITYMTAPNKQ